MKFNRFDIKLQGKNMCGWVIPKTQLRLLGEICSMAVSLSTTSLLLCLLSILSLKAHQAAP